MKEKYTIESILPFLKKGHLEITKKYRGITPTATAAKF